MLIIYNVFNNVMNSSAVLSVRAPVMYTIRNRKKCRQPLKHQMWQLILMTSVHNQFTNKTMGKVNLLEFFRMAVTCLIYISL